MEAATTTGQTESQRADARMCELRAEGLSRAEARLQAYREQQAAAYERWNATAVSEGPRS